MPDVSFSNLVAVSAVAFAAPLLLGLAPRVRLPAVVLEIVAGIAIGPSGLGWVKPDLPVQVLSVVGLGFLLLLAGLEVEPDRLRGRLLDFPASASSCPWPSAGPWAWRCASAAWSGHRS